MKNKPFFPGTLVVLIATALLLPLLSSSCSLFPNKAAEAMVRVYADSAAGQGIIVDKTGYVVTGSRSFSGSQAIFVELKSGDRYEARALCLDRARDIAVIRMQGNFPVLQPLMPADSDMVQQGDEVSVVHYLPESKGLSTSKGNITDLPTSNGIYYLQTGAAVDVGTAGGALLNKEGELIGVMSRDSGPDGREGYALTSNEVAAVVIQAQQVEADPLEIVSVEPPRVTNTSAILVWQTNRPATAQVEYGLQSGIYAFQTDKDAALLVEHDCVVDNLQPGLTYYFRVRSVDCCANEVVSQENSLITSTTAPAGNLNILNVRVLNLTSSALSVRWITNKPASGTVLYANAEISKQEAKTDPEMVYEHEVRIEDLKPETLYFINVRSDTGSETDLAEASPVTTPSAAPVCCKVFCRIPDFDFQAMDEGQFSNADLSGKETIIVFAKTACSFCMQQSLFLNDYYASNPNEDIRMLVVISGEKMQDVKDWVKKYDITVPVYLDASGSLANACRLRTIPSWLIVDTGSVIKYFKSGGFGSKHEMEDSIKNSL
ncbi:MAG: trypsin-like peptidase domain-containing protein [Dehalococcoidia bacterium]|nr:trypsin-like peptidase domain-containing protein [Dehalococcoidia bacterium]